VLLALHNSLTSGYCSWTDLGWVLYGVGFGRLRPSIQASCTGLAEISPIVITKRDFSRRSTDCPPNSAHSTSTTSQFTQYCCPTTSYKVTNQPASQSPSNPLRDTPLQLHCRNSTTRSVYLRPLHISPSIDLLLLLLSSFTLFLEEALIDVREINQNEPCNLYRAASIHSYTVAGRCRLTAEFISLLPPPLNNTYISLTASWHLDQR